MEYLFSLDSGIIEDVSLLTRVFSMGTAKVFADDIMQDFVGRLCLTRLL
jgi:hypothetical protein